MPATTLGGLNPAPPGVQAAKCSMVPSFLDDFGRCLPVCGIHGSRMRRDGDGGVATNNRPSPPGPHGLFPAPDSSCLMPVWTEESRASWAQHCSNHTFLVMKSYRITLIPPASQEKPHQRASNQIPCVMGTKGDGGSHTVSPALSIRPSAADTDLPRKLTCPFLQA